MVIGFHLAPALVRNNASEGENLVTRTYQVLTVWIINYLVEAGPGRKRY